MSEYTTYSAEFKAAKLEEYLSSGKPVSVFCRENGIKYTTFRRWLDKLEINKDNLADGTNLTLVEVTDRIRDAMNVVSLQKKTIVLTVNGFRIEMDSADLKAFTRSLRDA